MQIYSVFDPAFRCYGKTLEGYDTAELCAALSTLEMPAEGAVYEPSTEMLEKLPIFSELRDREFGGMPTQMGKCCGFNSAMNMMEYHRDSEVIFCLEETILLLGKMDDIENGLFDTSHVKAFRLPAKTFVELYATTLHNCPIPADLKKGFRAACLLARGTNEEAPEIEKKTLEDSWLAARNNWSIAHPDTEEAKQGICAAITGENIDLTQMLL